MREFSEYEREKWTEASRRKLAQELDAGDIVEPDKDNPAHTRLLRIAQEVAEETGLPAKIYIQPLFETTEENRMHYGRYQLDRCRAYPLVDAVVIPEAADIFFTDDEMKAVLEHEFDHVKRKDLAYAKTAAVEEAEDAEREVRHHRHARVYPEMVREAEARRDAAIRTLSEVSTESEVHADEGAIRSGHASDLIAALEKIEIGRHAADKMDFYPPQDIIDYVSAVAAQKRQSTDPISAAKHTKETFVERLQRLEKAAESERPSRGR